MNIMITGITGLFGSYLAKEFRNYGQIHGLKRASSDLELTRELNGQVVWHEGDVNDYQSLEVAFEGMDMIIHAAGLVSFNSSDEKKLLEVNVGGTTNVVNVMLQKEIKNLIHISSVAALGRTSENLQVDENQKWTASPLNTAYAISKYLGELEAWRGAQEGLDILVVNPSVLLGKIADKRSSSAIYQYVLKEKKFFPKGNLNYIDVRDAATITLALFKMGKWNERFILNRESMSYQDFFNKVAKEFGKKPPEWPASNKFLKLISSWYQLKAIFGSTDFNKEAIKSAQLPIVFENTKINSLLDYTYRSLEETLTWAAGNKN